jgi:phosphoribosylformimino-5-aminoimidazole carboxamide ribotide isomerase
MAVAFLCRPAIDLINGECVRLTGGDFAQKTAYSADPLAMAQSFEAVGLTHLHLVDLDGAKAGSPRHLAVLEKLSANTQLRIDYGGGIKTLAQAEAVLAAGAAQINIGSLAVKAPEVFREMLQTFGSQHFVLCADTRDGYILTHGWQEASQARVTHFVQKWVAAGVTQVLCTDVNRDGKLTGPAINLYAELLAAVPGLHLIASGGIRHLADLQALYAIGMRDAVIGKALYEGHITREELAAFQQTAGQPPFS